VDKFEKYELFPERTQRLSERRQIPTQIYLTVVTATFAVFAFLPKVTGFRGWGSIPVSLPLFLIGATACFSGARALLSSRESLAGITNNCGI
jgi:hypothetical protein